MIIFSKWKVAVVGTLPHKNIHDAQGYHYANRRDIFIANAKVLEFESRTANAMKTKMNIACSLPASLY